MASVVPRQLATDAPALGIRLGTRCFFPPQCTCSLRCARAPLGGAQGLFYDFYLQETIQRPRTNANGTSRNLTEPHAVEMEIRNKETIYHRRIQSPFSRFFLRNSLSLEILGSELQLMIFLFSPFRRLFWPRSLEDQSGFRCRTR